MAQQITENLWRLDIPLVGSALKNLNSYLITGPRSLLIDTGFREDACREAMERQLAEVGVDRDRMDIFLTHLHSDHTGLAPELIRPGCRIYIGESDGHRLEEDRKEENWRALYERYRLDGFSKPELEILWGTNPAQNAAPSAWEGCTYLQDGDELTYGGHTLRCLLTPGHTPGHMCLYDPKAKWLFSGDHVLFHISPNICRWPGVADSLGDYLQSLKAVRELPVELLLPAHRAETGILAQRVDELLAHHARRIEDVLHIVADHPGLTPYQIAGHIKWSIRCNGWEDFPLNQKFFAVGETLSHLDYLAVRGRVVCREAGGNHVYHAVSGGKL